MAFCKVGAKAVPNGKLIVLLGLMGLLVGCTPLEDSAGDDDDASERENEQVGENDRDSESAWEQSSDDTPDTFDTEDPDSSEIPASPEFLAELGPGRDLDIINFWDCPKTLDDWLIVGGLPLTTVVLGGQSYHQDELGSLLVDVDDDEADLRLYLAAELAAAKLNLADDWQWGPAAELVAEADRLLEGIGSGVLVETEDGQLAAQIAESLAEYNDGVMFEECNVAPSATEQSTWIPAAAAKAMIPPPPLFPKGISGYAELHTHMFAEYAYNGEFIWGTVDDLTTPQGETMAEAMPRCSGKGDHASLRGGYGSGLGIVSEALTAMGGELAFMGINWKSKGDTGLHLRKRNGYDDRSCAPEACLGSVPCLWKGSQAACESADPGICKDPIDGNISLSALVACNTKLSRSSCEGSGYCSADNSSFLIGADDINWCNTKWPNCDSGDICIQHSLTKSLTCSDLDQAECQTHSSECDWKICEHDHGMFECNDLNQSQCGNYSQCNWKAGDCDKDPLMALVPFECNDLSISDCGNHSECNTVTECKHQSGSLTCNDLSHSECDYYSKCNWSSFWGDCRKKTSQILSPFECNDLTISHCGNHSECKKVTSCKHSSGSLTCSDLNSSECSTYGHWCNWDPGKCKNPSLINPFECNDLTKADCLVESECRLAEKCVADLNPLTALECNDLSVSSCGDHSGDGCEVRDCTAQPCEWNEWGDCKWRAVWPPFCGTHYHDWPAWDTPTHQQHYWGFLQDAHKKGLQVVTASVLSVHPLSQLMAGYGGTPYEVIKTQLEAANTFDSHHDWIEIALSPDDVRRIVDEGKLAMILSIESEYAFCKDEPCGAGNDEENISNISTTLDEYEALGVRSFQIVGHFDNLFSGTAVFEKAMLVMQYFYENLTPGLNGGGQITYNEFKAELGSGWLNALANAGAYLNRIPGVTFAQSTIASFFPINGMDDLNDIHTLLAIFGNVSGPKCFADDGVTPVDSCAECLADDILCLNRLGLTVLGEELVRELISRNMLIDISHMSEKGVADLEQIVKTVNPGSIYPIYVSHGSPREPLIKGDSKSPNTEKPSSNETLALIAESGGMFGQRTGAASVNLTGRYGDCQGSSSAFAELFDHLRSQGVNVGFGVDMNGMTHTTPPRFIDSGDRRARRRGRHGACLGNSAQQAAQTNPVSDDPLTPYTDESDLNTKGLGHIGLLGAFVQDLQNVGFDAQHLQHIDESAENFVRMWSKAKCSGSSKTTTVQIEYPGKTCPEALLEDWDRNNLLVHRLACQGAYGGMVPPAVGDTKASSCGETATEATMDIEVCCE